MEGKTGIGYDKLDMFADIIALSMGYGEHDIEINGTKYRVVVKKVESGNQAVLATLFSYLMAANKGKPVDAFATGLRSGALVLPIDSNLKLLYIFHAQELP